MNLVFLHSNGFSAPVYQGFFDALSPHKVQYPPTLGHGNDFPKRSWKPMVKGVTQYLEQEVKTPIVLIGHSLGGVISLFIAAQRPDLIERVIFLDPPAFGPGMRNLLKVGKAIGLNGRVPPASLAKKRRREFESRERAFTYFSGKSLFRNFDEQSLRDYVQHGLKESPKGGFSLAYSPLVEYYIFKTIPAVLPKGPLPVASDFIYSAAWEVLKEKDVKWLKKRYNTTSFHPFDAGHMFPLEQPIKAAQLVKKILEERNS